MVRLLFRDACVAVLVGAEQPVVESVNDRGRIAVIVLKEVLINNERLAFPRFRHTDKARHDA